MEIEEFIEQDILVFLDDRLDKQHSTLSLRQRAPIQSRTITRDYEYEFFMMLDRRDLDGAKRVLHDLKATFDECSNNMPEKLQLKSLLLDLYEKFKDHLDAQNTFTRIDAQLGGTTTPQNLPLNDTTPEGKPSSSTTRTTDPIAQSAPDIIRNRIAGESDTATAPAPAPEFSAPTTVALTANAAQRPIYTAESAASAPYQPYNEIMAQLDTVDTLLVTSRPQEAVRAYREAKRMALRRDVIDRTVVERFITLHAKILERIAPTSPPNITIDTQRMEYMDNKARRTPPAVTQTKSPLITTNSHNTLPTTASTPQSTMRVQDGDKEMLIAMEQEKRALDAHLDKYDIANAMRSYRQMRLLAQQLRSKTNVERVAKKLASLHQIISQMKAHTASERMETIGKTLTEGRP
ncbi:TPA: hypothetical protein HA251_04510 [Candidatus Woesearchaeota archaeon]|nr:hypothetical protein [Candidatus Woesearchaeota archaeon]